VRIPDAGTFVPTVFARSALVAGVFGLLAVPCGVRGATAVMAASLVHCPAVAGPSAELAGVAVGRSAMQARFRPVYWNSLQVADTLIKSRLDSLITRSRSFAKAIERMRETRFLTLIATAEQADLILGLDCLVGPIATGVLGDAGYMAGTAYGDVVGAFVRIDVTTIRAIAERRLGTPASADPTAVDAAIAALIDDVLIHEIWGHVVPVAELRHDSGRCADPEPDQDPLASCVIRRENRLRAELGLRPTEQYGIFDGDALPAAYSNSPASVRTASPAG
jgi:hypothetical protein